MNYNYRFYILGPFFFLPLLIIILSTDVSYSDLREVRERGVLRHLGVSYARFITGSGDGFSADLVKGFAEELGVRYEYVEANWEHIISSLTGKTFDLDSSGRVSLTGEVEKTGDIIANGLTILPWRKQLINYSTPTFPSGIWLVARADAAIKPIVPTGTITNDITLVKKLLNNITILSKPGTCLDSDLYNFEGSGAQFITSNLKMNEFVPAIINKKADACLLDVADALIALEKWPGQIKIIGPLSPPQEMAAGFQKSDHELIEHFNKYLDTIRSDGRYNDLLMLYYPNVKTYFPDFFKKYKQKTTK